MRDKFFLCNAVDKSHSSRDHKQEQSIHRFVIIHPILHFVHFVLLINVILSWHYACPQTHSQRFVLVFAFF